MKMTQINARVDSIGGLAINQPFWELQERHLSEAQGRSSGLALEREEIGEVAIMEEHSQFVIFANNEIALGKDGTTRVVSPGTK